MHPCAAEVTTDPFAASRAAFAALLVELGGEGAARLGHAELEEVLDLRGRELPRLLYQDHLELRRLREALAVGAHPAPVTGPDGVIRHAIESGHERLLATVFGTVTVGRSAWRAKGQRNVYPADAALRLPRGRHSHGLRRLAALEAVRGSFDQATEAIGGRCEQVVGKRQLEQLTVAAAADIDAFSQAVAPQPCTDATVLVASVDGKGVVMRPEALREATRHAAEAKGPGPYRTRLASGEKVIQAVFDQAEQRDPTHRRTWVMLVDGARHQLDLVCAEAARRGVRIHILIDLIHVLEYVWKAAR